MVKKIRTVMLLLLISLSMLFLSGCWNYREIDEMAIVVGVAVDKGINKNYLVTMEIVELRGGTETQLLTKIISLEGNSMFEAIRSIISYIGKKAYWSHAKVVIVSQDIAKEGLVKIIDWFSRDTEARENIYLLVSKHETAKEIFEGKPVTSEVLSFQLEKMFHNQRNLGKAPSEDIRQFINVLSTEGSNPVAPVISIKDINGQKRVEIIGTAVFRSDRLVGFLDELDTQTMLFIQNEVKGGVIYSEEKVAGSYVTLEIFKSKTKLKPIIDENSLAMEIDIEIEAAINEINDIGDVIGEDGRTQLKHHYENLINKRVTELVEKVQTQYNTDIFGFATKLYRNEPRLWKEIRGSWKEEFRNLKVKTNTKVKIINSAQLAKPFEVEE